jgi:glycosyltransferase involved in cell wall biosynthesis/GT2 family glycosyltransferase
VEVRILTNSLQWGDAVSTHCLLLKRYLEELGVPARLYTGSKEGRFAAETLTADKVLDDAQPGDILVHQFFNATTLLPFVERFPGWRLLMYHNITPPAWLPYGSDAYWSCVRGLQQLETMGPLYDAAYGMSEFSRSDLDRNGFPATGVFPLLVDLERLRSVEPDTVTLTTHDLARPFLLFIGRVAPNKRIEDLIKLLAEYSRWEPDSRLVVVGDTRQHPEYVASLEAYVDSLGLVWKQDVILTGKIPEAQMIAYLRRALAFVCMSEHEGFCAPILEAMAFGLPVFIKDSTAVTETAGEAGVKLPTSNFYQAAQLLHECLSSSARRCALEKASLQRAALFFDDPQRRRVGEWIKQFQVPCPRPAYEPRVSVVINTCNRAPWLQRCLASLERQTYKNFEVVVVNGPSTDNTDRVLKRFEGRIQTAATTKRMISVSRNEGIIHAQGEIIAFLDDDALPAEDWLEHIVAPFCRQRVGAVGGCTFRMNGREIEFRNGLLDEEGFVKWDEPSPGLEYDWQRGMLNTVEGCNCAFRRSALQEIGGFDERIEYYHDEADVVMRIAAKGYFVEHRPRAVVYHEAAPSAVRKNKFRLNYYPIAKNSVYVALRNYRGSRRSKLALRIIARLLLDKGLLLLSQVRHGTISCWTYAVSMARLCTGLLIGTWVGMWSHGLYRNIPPLDSSRFKPFSPKGRSLSIGLLSQNLPEKRPGGIATYTLTLARALADLGCQVHVFSADVTPGDHFEAGVWFHHVRPEQLADHGDLLGNNPVLRKNLEFSRGIQLRLNDIHARWGLDIFESPNWDFEGLFALADGRIPGVVRAHSPLYKVMEMQRWDYTDDLHHCLEAEGLTYRLASVVTGSTDSVLGLVRSKYSLDEIPVHKIPLGLPEPRNDAGLLTSSNRLRVLFLGRLERRKGIIPLLRAIPAVLDAIPEVEFLIAGEDGGAPGGATYKQWFMREYGNRVKSADRVRFLGRVSEEERYRLYTACDVFCGPSLYESFGLVYIEAMSHGKPVVACKTGGISEVVEDGVTGILVPPEDPDALVDALVHLLRDPSMRTEMGKAAKARYLREFTVDAMARRTLDVYQYVVREWRRCHQPYWRGRPVELRRSSATRIDFIPLYGRTLLYVESASRECVVYGPYIGLPAGVYRIQFEIILSAPLPENREVATIDVFNARLGGVLKQRTIKSHHFRHGIGNVFDLFIAVPVDAPPEFEFRVHSAATAPFLVGDIQALACLPHGNDPPGALPIIPKWIEASCS